MKKFILALVLCLLLVGVVVAKTETVDLGPFTAKFDMGDEAGEHQFIIYPPMQDRDHNTYSFRIDSGGKGWYIYVYIDDYGKLVDISASRLMDDEIELCRGQEVRFDWRQFAAVGGRPAVLAKEIYDNGKSFSYYAAYSPDGVGYTGSVIASIYSKCPENMTNTFLSKLKISRT